jgi:hypothetical protein
VTTVSEVYDYLEEVLTLIGHNISDSEKPEWLISAVRIWDEGEDYRNLETAAAMVEGRIRSDPYLWNDLLLGKLSASDFLVVTPDIWQYDGTAAWGWRVPTGTHFDKDIQIWEVVLCSLNEGAVFAKGILNTLPNKDLIAIAKYHADDCAWVYHSLAKAVNYAKKYGYTKINQIDITESLALLSDTLGGYLYIEEGIHC